MQPNESPTHPLTLGAIAVAAFAATILLFQLGQAASYWTFAGEAQGAWISLGDQLERLGAGQFRAVRVAGTLATLLLSLAVFPAVGPLRETHSLPGRPPR